jgi:MIF4G like
VKSSLRDLISYYVSQLPDFRGDSLYQRLEESKAPSDFMTEVFQQLIRMSFFKRVKENTDEKYHQYLPQAESSQSQMNFAFIGSGSGEDMKGVNPDADLLLDKLNSKETPERIKEFLDSGDVQSSGQQLRQIYLECILSRTRKSLEHLKRQVEIHYHEIIEPWFVKDPEGQKTLVKTVVSVYAHNHTRCLQVLEKLW